MFRVTDLKKNELLDFDGNFAPSSFDLNEILNVERQYTIDDPGRPLTAYFAIFEIRSAIYDPGRPLTQQVPYSQKVRFNKLGF